MHRRPSQSAAQAEPEQPYLTAALPGIGGRIKATPADFRVDEQPLYVAAGDGTHVYVRIEKISIPTPAAVERIARYLGVRPSMVGFAGLKDAHAIATQWLSIEHADPERLARFRDANVRVLVVTRHTNKLRPGHLAGNRFTIRIRDTDAADLPAAQAILDVLDRRGVPNYFGRQRFGLRGDSDVLGAALIRDDLEAFWACYLGRPGKDDPPDCRAARAAFDAGNVDDAMSHWPKSLANERRALAAYQRRGPRAALGAIDKRMRRLFVSACQSRIFNRVVAARIDAIDRVDLGDLTQKTDTGGVFLVEDVPAEQVRADAWQVSPTGPIVGTRCRLAEGQPGQAERAAIAADGFTPDDFSRVGALKLKGGRRPLRFRLQDATVAAGQDETGAFLEVAFAAPSGCYATITLREITKCGTL